MKARSSIEVRDNCQYVNVGIDGRKIVTRQFDINITVDAVSDALTACKAAQAELAAFIKDLEAEYYAR